MAGDPNSEYTPYGPYLPYPRRRLFPHERARASILSKSYSRIFGALYVTRQMYFSAIRDDRRMNAIIAAARVPYSRKTR